MLLEIVENGAIPRVGLYIVIGSCIGTGTQHLSCKALSHFLTILGTEDDY